MTKELMEYLDKCAYYKPQTMPSEIRRGAKYAKCRIYFEFMVMVYELSKAGADVEELKARRDQLIQELDVLDVLTKGAYQSFKQCADLQIELCPECRKKYGEIALKGVGEWT